MKDTTPLANNAVKRRIYDFTAIAPEDQNREIYEKGREYIRHLTDECQEWADTLDRSRLFWVWWTNQWNIRDEGMVEALSTFTNKLSIETCRRMYEELHKPSLLAHEIFPPKIVYTDIEQLAKTA